MLSLHLSGNDGTQPYIMTKIVDGSVIQGISRTAFQNVIAKAVSIYRQCFKMSFLDRWPQRQFNGPEEI